MLTELLFVVIWIVAAIGWVLNIVKMVGMLGGDVTAMFIARIAGIVIAPLGVVLGFL